MSPASFTVIAAKALSGMVQISVAGYSQFKHPAPYVMLVVMVATAVIQVKYLNQAMKGFASTVVVPTNFVFFTISAILAGDRALSLSLGRLTISVFFHYRCGGTWWLNW